MNKYTDIAKHYQMIISDRSLLLSSCKLLDVLLLPPSFFLSALYPDALTISADCLSVDV